MKCTRCGAAIKDEVMQEGYALFLFQIREGKYLIDTIQPSVTGEQRVGLCTSCARPATEEEVRFILSRMATQPSIIIS